MRGCHHYKSNPTMKIKFAVRISITVPIIMEPVKWGNDYLVDGGLLCNYPLSYFDIEGLPNTKQVDSDLFINYDTLGLKLLSADEISGGYIIYSGNRLMKNVGDYTLSIINTLHSHIENLYITSQRWDEDGNVDETKRYWNRTIAINTGNIDTMDVDIRPSEKKFLIDEGIKGANEWLVKSNFN